MLLNFTNVGIVYYTLCCVVGGGSQILCPEDNTITTLRRSSRLLERNTPDLATNNCEYERRRKQIRQRRREADWTWLNACLGVADGDFVPVEAFLSAGGNPARQLTPAEVTLLNRPSAFDTGYTLVHLAIR